nr:response regulator [uncultured Flavobacterium sp.]
MFKKVLIAEDIDSINLAVVQTLSEMGIAVIDHVKYCDDAYLKIKKAIADNDPYDLFISDLSFEQDHRQVTLQSGEEAIAKIRDLQRNLKIIVYSIEDKGFKIRTLLDEIGVNAYVQKGRNSLSQLKIAIMVTAENDSRYLSPHLQHILNEKDSGEIDNFDVQIIKQLSVGITQDELGSHFKQLGITPNSKSTIEKRISKLKDHFRANNTVHLIAIAKDLGIA